MSNAKLYTFRPIVVASMKQWSMSGNYRSICTNIYHKLEKITTVQLWTNWNYVLTSLVLVWTDNNENYDLPTQKKLWSIPFENYLCILKSLPMITMGMSNNCLDTANVSWKWNCFSQCCWYSTKYRMCCSPVTIEHTQNTESQIVISKHFKFHHGWQANIIL